MKEATKRKIKIILAISGCLAVLLTVKLFFLEYANDGGGKNTDSLVNIFFAGVMYSGFFFIILSLFFLFIYFVIEKLTE